MSVKVPGLVGAVGVMAAAGALKRKSVFIATGSELTDTVITENPTLKVRYENNYKMKPMEGKEARPSVIKTILNEVLTEQLAEQKYNAEKCSALATDISNIVMRRVKGLNIPRYKYVCHVTIGQKQNQGVNSASRCIWDTTTDTFSSANWESDALFATAMLHCVYLE